MDTASSDRQAFENLNPMVADGTPTTPDSERRTQTSEACASRKDMSNKMRQTAADVPMEKHSDSPSKQKAAKNLQRKKAKQALSV